MTSLLEDLIAKFTARKSGFSAPGGVKAATV
jgi:hypothetical protein